MLFSLFLRSRPRGQQLAPLGTPKVSAIAHAHTTRRWRVPLLGHLVSVAVALKGLPLAYDKDLQEDKAPLFDAMDTLSMCLRVIPPMLDRLVVHRDRTRRAAEGGYANATDLADYLVGKGIPFRDAHEVTGRLVRLAMERGVPLEGLGTVRSRGSRPPRRSVPSCPPASRP